MTQINLTSAQSELFAMATDGVVICDVDGNVVARIPPVFDEQEAEIIAEAKRRLASDEPRRTSAEMRARIGLPER